MTKSDFLPVITASEVGQHAYCARSWWLGKVKGYAPANVLELDAGRQAHENHGRLVVRSRRWQYLAYALLLLAFCVAAGGIVLSVRGR